MYDERLLLYADILGWKAEIYGGEDSKLLTAIKNIHRQVVVYNETFREGLVAQEETTIQTELGPTTVERINPSILKV